jgi:hypothetical protein
LSAGAPNQITPGDEEDPAMTVFVHVNTGKRVGDAEHVKVFATTDTWFEGKRSRRRSL